MIADFFSEFERAVESAEESRVCQEMLPGSCPGRGVS